LASLQTSSALACSEIRVRSGRLLPIEAKAMKRKIFATIFGVVTAFLVVLGFEWIGHRIWPLPANLDWKDPETVAKFMAEISSFAFSWLLLGWVIALIVGVLSCARLHSSNARWPQWSMAAFFAIAVSSNFFMLPHPVWFVAASLFTLGVSAWLAVSFSSKRF